MVKCNVYISKLSKKNQQVHIHRAVSFKGIMFLEIENYKIRLIHVFILFSTFRSLLKALSSYCKYFFYKQNYLKNNAIISDTIL